MDTQPEPTIEKSPNRKRVRCLMISLVTVIAFYTLVSIYVATLDSDSENAKSAATEKTLNTIDEVIYTLTGSQYVFWTDEKPNTSSYSFHPLRHPFTDEDIPLYKWNRSTQNYEKIIDSLLSLPNAPVSNSSRQELTSLTIEGAREDKIYFGKRAYEGSWLFGGFVLDLNNTQAGFAKLPIWSSWIDSVRNSYILGLSEGSTEEQYSVVLYEMGAGNIITLLDSSELSADETIFSGCMGQCYSAYWKNESDAIIEVYFESKSDPRKLRKIEFRFDPYAKEEKITRWSETVYQD